MKASSIEIALDGVMLTKDGPCLVGDVTCGDQIVVVERGEERLARLNAVDAGQGDAECVRMFTALGDVVVPVRRFVMTREGPRSAGDVAAAVHEGRTVRAETIAPPPSDRLDGGGAARHAEEALRALVEPPRAVQIPLVTSSVGEAVRGAYARIGVKLSERRDERWLALTQDGGGARRPTGKSAVLRAQDVLCALAWEIDAKGGIEARLPVQESRLRRLLIATLIADGMPFTIKWVPGYRPVEARLRLSAASWPAFVSVESARLERGPTRMITLASERPTLPVGLTLVS
jgi:hypothetical protein